MKEFKGTPGDWSGKTVVISSKSFSLSSGFTSDEAKANGALAEAAPQLLSALQDALHAHDKHGEHSEWDFARAAIAKVLGESQ